MNPEQSCPTCKGTHTICKRFKMEGIVGDAVMMVECPTCGRDGKPKLKPDFSDAGANI